MKVMCVICFLLWVSVCTFGQTADDDINIESHGIFTKVLGRSGKIMIGWRKDVEEGDLNVIVWQLDELQEVDVLGNTVGKTGPVKHSFKSFASQKFTFTAMRNEKIQDIRVKSFSYYGTLKGLTSTLTVKIYIILDRGNITVLGERQEVRPGQVKFNIALEKWEFCNILPPTCWKGNTPEYGAAVWLTAQIKSKTRAEKREDKDKKFWDNMIEFGLGNDATLKLSKKVLKDGKLVDMSPPPFSWAHGSKQKFRFHFNRFENKTVYDPTIDAGVYSGATTVHVTTLITILMFIAIRFI